MTWLRQAIAAGRWQAGEQIPTEGALAVQLGVGRSSVREAVKSLEQAGLLVIRPGRGGGTYVAEPSYRQLGAALGTLFQMRGFDLADFLDARRFFEPGVAAGAAERATREDIVEMQFLLDQIEARLQEGHDVSELSQRLHFAIARATHNALIVMHAAAMLDLRRQLPATGVADRAGRRRVLEQHRQIVAAIAAHDAPRARDLMEQHIRDNVLDLAAP